MRISLTRWRAGGMALAALLALGGVAAFGASEGHPAKDARMRSGAAWLASAKVGQVTLLDGASAEVAAQVQVAAPGNALGVVQQGSTAYAVDETAGTVRRVDGATFEPGTPESPIPDARAGLVAIPGFDVLFALDSRRGILASTDPKSLARRGELLSLASQLSLSTAIVDDSGTLWAIDTNTGDLVWVSGGTRTIRRQVAQPGRSVLTTANGRPVIVDTTARKAIVINRETGGVDGSFDLDLRTDDTVQISGSPRADRLYIVVGRGALNICDLGAGRCDKAVALNAGSDLGAAVEAGNRLFVPDHTTGQVWIVDLATSKVVAQPEVLKPAGKFQLLTRDGVVFYNDPDSNKAGVIQLDGTVREVAKYDTTDPNKGLNIPVENPANPQQPPVSQPNPPPAEPQPPQQPTQPPTQPQQPPQGNQPPPTNPRLPPQNPPTNPPPGQPEPPPTPTPREPTLEIVVSKATPTADEPITLQVNDTGGTIPAEASVDWTFGDNETGSGITTSHQWATARENPYLVTVRITYPDNRIATTSTNITVRPKPTFTLTVTIPGGGGTVSGGGINCPPTCSAAIDVDTVVTLIAQPDTAHQQGTWGGACSGASVSCDVTMNAAKSVSYTFGVPVRRVTLGVAAPGGGTITGGGINCPGACSVTVDQGTVISLTANPDVAHRFGGWGGACGGQGQTCAVTMTGDQNVSVTFTAKARFRLTVATNGLGPAPHEHGVITGPNGIACRREHQTPPECTAEFFEGESVTLTGRPDPGFHLGGWQVQQRAVPATPSVTLVMNQNEFVFCNFDPN
jgi:hypothetical protein